MLAQQIACAAAWRGFIPANAEALLLLYEYAGLSCAEIGALAGVEASAVRMRLSRARTKFRAMYKKELI